MIRACGGKNKIERLNLSRYPSAAAAMPKYSMSSQSVGGSIVCQRAPMPQVVPPVRQTRLFENDEQGKAAGQKAFAGQRIKGITQLAP